MKKIPIFALLMLTLSTNAQVKRGSWDIGPVVMTNNAYGNVAELLKSVISMSPHLPGSFWKSNRWWIPTFGSKHSIMQKIETPDGKAKVERLDRRFRNYSFGFHVGYMPYVEPIGFDVQVDYERQSWKAKMPEQDDFKEYAKQMVVPTALLRFCFGDYLESDDLNFMVEAGAKYNYAFKAKGDYDDVKSVEKGFTGVLGFVFVHVSGRPNIILQMRYEHDFFDYFNKDFTTDTGVKPYENVKTKHGVLGLLASILF